MNIKRILNTIFRIAMFYIVFWAFCTFMIEILDLEFYYTSLLVQFYFSGIFLLPISIMLNILKPIKNKPSLIYPLRIVSSLFLAFGGFILQIAIIFSHGCGYQDYQELYESKPFSTQKIVMRSYQCDDYFPDGPNGRPYKTTFIPPFFKSSTPIDTSSINTEKWRKITDN